MPAVPEPKHRFRSGRKLIRILVNFDGTNPYNNGKPSQYRQETVEVKTLPANAWGLYEMHGNVWEWCQDWYGDYPSQPVIDPQGPESGDSRVLRGGSWINDGRHCRSADRYDYSPGTRLASLSVSVLPEVIEPASPAREQASSRLGHTRRQRVGHRRGMGCGRGSCSYVPRCLGTCTK